MIVRKGPQHWKNIHTTFETDLENMMDIDNSSSDGQQITGFDLFKQAARDVDALIQEASSKGKQIRALGSAWALTDIHLTDSWMLNTKLLNGCFDISDPNFEDSFPKERRPYVVLAQCGISVAELNVHLEITATSGFKRALRTAGIGAGQTIAGAINGNTHGAAVNFGAMPEFVVGIQLANGTGQSIWIERESEPVMNDQFISKMDAKLVRDDDIFNSALVTFGAFGVITALAIETEPIYHLKFPKMQDISFANLKHKLSNMDYADPPNLHHFEFIFNPYDKDESAVLVIGTKEDYIPNHEGPDPLWIITNEKGFAPGDKTPPFLLNLPISASWKSSIQYEEYKKNSILSDVRGSSGQLYTATITYLEGYSESAIAVGIEDAAKMIDVIIQVVKKVKLPSICQSRVVKSSRATLGFTYLGSRSVVFEFALVNDKGFEKFENELITAMRSADIKYTFHWSKNSGIDRDKLFEMYGVDRVETWKRSRESLFNGNKKLMAVFNNKHLERADLAVDASGFA